MRQTVNSKKKAGRPKGRATRFHGIMDFCRRHGYSHQHVRAVLSGGRQSAQVRRLWAGRQARQMKEDAR